MWLQVAGLGGVWGRRCLGEHQPGQQVAEQATGQRRIWWDHGDGAREMAGLAWGGMQHGWWIAVPKQTASAQRN